MFIIDNRASFGKHQKVSKYYKNECLQNFILLLMFILAAPINKKVIFRLDLLILSKKRAKNKFQSLVTPKFTLSEKIGKAVSN